MKTVPYRFGVALLACLALLVGCRSVGVRVAKAPPGTGYTSEHDRLIAAIIRAMVSGALAGVSVTTFHEGEVVELELTPSSNRHSKQAVRRVENQDWHLAYEEFLFAVRENSSDHWSWFGLAVCCEKLAEGVLQSSVTVGVETNALSANGLRNAFVSSLSTSLKRRLSYDPCLLPRALEHYKKALEHCNTASRLSPNRQYAVSSRRLLAKVRILEGIVADSIRQTERNQDVKPDTLKP